jgi:hypothetical protein
MAHLLPLPDSRCRDAKRVIRIGPMNWIPIFCANCGADGGRVPQENMSFAFYLCDNCFEKHGAIEGTYAEPDVIFWAKVKAAQIEKYGRELTPEELVLELENESSIISKLSKDRPGAA